MTVQLEVRNLSYTYRNSQPSEIAIPVLNNLSFKLGGNEFLVIVGPSGCGKTTLLKLISAFLSCEEGEILIDGGRKRAPYGDCVLISQDHDLFHWKTVLENTTFGLRARGLPRAQQVEKAMHYLKLVNLSDFSRQYPNHLSAGMKQRLALARALAVEPKLILMDEPLASLDWQSRLRLQDELLRICEITKQTVLMTTHDVGEAIYLADRLMVLTERPAQVANMIPVPISKPRSQQQRYQSDFLVIEQEILRTLSSCNKMPRNTDGIRGPTNPE